MTYYAGLDVSLRTVNICVIDDQGELVAETKLASDVQDIVAYLDELSLDIESISLVAGKTNRPIRDIQTIHGEVDRRIFIQCAKKSVVSGKTIN